MRRLLLLANPSASAFTGALFRDVVRILEADFEVNTEWPHGADAARKRAAEAAGEGYHVVAAMGGDGVVHHVANGLAYTPAALAIIPSGTTNVLARIFGLPTDARKAAAAMGTLDAVPTRMALVEAETTTGPITEYATFALGVGYDADVVSLAEERPQSKIWLGGAHYAQSAVSTLLREWRKRPANLMVEVDGEQADGVSVLVQVHSPYTYFGPVPLHITKEPVDGLAAVVVNDLEVHRAVEIVVRSVVGRPFPERLGAGVYTAFEALLVVAEPPSPFQADGEHLGMATHVLVREARDALLALR